MIVLFCNSLFQSIPSPNLFTATGKSSAHLEREESELPCRGESFYCSE